MLTTQKRKVESIGFYDCIVKDIFLIILQILIPYENIFSVQYETTKKRKRIFEFLNLRGVDRTFRKWINDYLFIIYGKMKWNCYDNYDDFYYNRTVLLILGQNLTIQKLPTVYKYIYTTKSVLITDNDPSLRVVSGERIKSVGIDLNSLFFVYCFDILDTKKLMNLFEYSTYYVLRTKLFSLNLQFSIEYRDYSNNVWKRFKFFDEKIENPDFFIGLNLGYIMENYSHELLLSSNKEFNEKLKKSVEPEILKKYIEEITNILK